MNSLLVVMTHQFLFDCSTLPGFWAGPRKASDVGDRLGKAGNSNDRRGRGIRTKCNLTASAVIAPLRLACGGNIPNPQP